MTLCTPCDNYENLDRPSDIEYTPNLDNGETCGKCGNSPAEEREFMGLGGPDVDLPFDNELHEPYYCVEGIHQYASEYIDVSTVDVVKIGIDHDMLQVSEYEGGD